MTPGEFLKHIEGWQERDERDWERAAFVAAISANPHLKRGNQLTIDKLLNRKKKRQGDAAGKGARQQPKQAVAHDSMEAQKFFAALGKKPDPKVEDDKFDALWNKVQKQRKDPIKVKAD